MDPAEEKELAIIERQEAMNKVMDQGDSDIQLFYNNAIVFVTGGSGLLGKQLVEKLFRSCNIKKMYLLMRCKKGKSIQERLVDMLQDPVFDVVRKKRPGFQDRIEIIEGDVALLKLGISVEDRKTITNEVSSIFHVAATVKFNEGLRKAILTNVRGTREALQLAQECKQLRSLVHTSTAYSHALASREGGEIFEQFYDTPSPEIVIQLAEEGRMDEAVKLMSEWPNTYCFTKAVAEHLVRAAGATLPASVIRPAIVISTYHEPLPGWVDPSSVYGANGLNLGMTMGIIHVVRANPQVKIGFIPADLVNNAAIAAGREAARRWHDGEKETVIYNMTNTRNYLTLTDAVRILHNELAKILSPKAVWYSYLFLAENDVTYNLLSFLLHHLPAVVVDVARGVMGKRPQLISLYKKVSKLTEALTYFLCHDWAFNDRNLVKLYTNMSENDRLIFNCDIGNICLTEMMETWTLGVRKYIVKDGLQGTKLALRKQNILKYLSYIVLFIYVLIFWMFIKLVIKMLFGL